MAELKGTFYGVSVGPGDPELMTLQAVRLIRQCPVLAAPQTASGQMLALDIAHSALGEALDGKTIVPLYFAMSRDPAALAASHEKAAAAAECAADRRHGYAAYHCARRLDRPRAGNARHQGIDESRQAIACLIGYPAAGR